MAAQNYSNRQGAFEYADSLKSKYMDEAARTFKDKDEVQMRRALKRYERGPGLFGWLRDRMASLVNMVKMAAFTVLLGRAETARRLEAGNKAQDRKDRMAEIKRETYIEFLQQKLQEKEKENAEPVTEKETTKETPEVTAEKGNIENQQTEVQQQALKETQKTKTEYELQCEERQQPFKEGLQAHLADVTRIRPDYIQIDSNQNKPGLWIHFKPLKEQQLNGEQWSLTKGFQLTPDGKIQGEFKTKEDRKLATLIVREVFAFTHEYAASKGNRFDGITPSMPQIEQVLKRAETTIDRKMKDDQFPKKDYTASLFGHMLYINQTTEQKTYSLDGKAIEIADGKTPAKAIKERYEEVVREKNRPYSKTREKEIEQIRAKCRDEYGDRFQDAKVQYQAKDIEQVVEKKLNGYFRNKDQADLEFSVAGNRVSLHREQGTIAEVKVNDTVIHEAVGEPAAEVKKLVSNYIETPLIDAGLMEKAPINDFYKQLEGVDLSWAEITPLDENGNQEMDQEDPAKRISDQLQANQEYLTDQSRSPWDGPDMGDDR